MSKKTFRITFTDLRTAADYFGEEDVALAEAKSFDTYEAARVWICNWSHLGDDVLSMAEID